ncbi:MAG: ArsA family ATPase [Deferribacterota bacterium]|nr:ArsA family ATPase [Deferribacterota bacterium]
MRDIYLICGKGGVGKSTCAASIAIALSNKNIKTLLLSTDFTPAIGDVLNIEIGSEFTRVKKHLYATALDQKIITDRWVKKFGPDFYEMLSNIVNLDEFDRSSRHSLLEYIGSAPSLREETMLDYIVEISKEGDFDKIIWDSAPAGETLNLLNMPQLLKKHLKSGAKIYESIDRLRRKISGKRSITDIINEWINLSDFVYNYLKENAAFIIVTNPEKVVFNRTVDIIKILDEYRMFIQGLVINKINTDVSCESFNNKQSKYIELIVNLAGGKPIAEIPFDFLGLESYDKLNNIGNILINNLRIE